MAVTASGATPAPSPQERSAFLADAAHRLASSLDVEHTLQQVVSLAVPVLGDLCIIDLLEDGTRMRGIVAHAIARKHALLQSSAVRARIDPAGAADRALATGCTQRTDAIAAPHPNDEHAHAIDTIGLRAHLAIPLRARCRVIGVLGIGISERDSRIDADTVVLAEGLASLAALAIDTARLRDHARRELDECQRTEQALKLSEQRFRTLMEQSPLSVQLLDAQGATVAVNASWERLWGHRLEDLDGYSVLHDPQLEQAGITPLLRRAFAGETVRLPVIAYDPRKSLDAPGRHEDPERWVAAWAYPVRDQDGRVREVVLVHEDVTEQRRAELRLQRVDARLRRVLDGTRMTVWDRRMEDDRVESSDNAREFWGRELRTIDDFRALLHPDDVHVVDRLDLDTLTDDAPQVIEFRIRRGDGDLRWVQSRFTIDRDADGRAVGVIGVSIDITEQRAAEEATRVLADAGRTLGASLDDASTLRSLTDVVVPRMADWCAVDLVAADGELERVAISHPDPSKVELARQLFEQYPPQRDQPVGIWSVIQKGEPEWSPAIDEALLARVARDAQHLALLRRLALRSYICVPLAVGGKMLGALTMVYSDSGRVFRASDVALAQDLALRAATALDNAQLYRRLQRDDARKNEFLATLAHELRNPLAPLRSGLAVLAATPDAQQQARMLSVMQRQLAHMVRLIDDLLDLSRVTTGAIDLRRERVAVVDVLERAVESSLPLLESAGIRLERHIDASAALHVDADPTRLAQAVTNLLNNAAKFTPRGGRVELAAAVVDGALQIGVSDNGIGIEPDRLPHLFEMFSRGSSSDMQGGLGIGLALVRRLVELHGGQVHAESAGPGHGSRFLLRLPLSDAAPGDDAGAPPAPAPQRPAVRTVLVVDDNIDAAESLAAMIGLDGHRVHVAHDADAALAQLDEVVPDIAFLDIGMRDVDGYELARRMRARPALASTTLVALTGWGRDEDRARASAAGFDHHLTKPADSDAVLALVAGAAAAP